MKAILMLFIIIFQILQEKKRLTINNKIKWSKSFLSSILVKDKNKELYTLENEDIRKLVKSSSETGYAY